MSALQGVTDALGRLASAALFGGLLLGAFWLTAQVHWPLAGVARYDFLLVYALLIQAVMIRWRLETPREVLVIALFHGLAMGMELFLTSPQIGSWHYPEAGHWRIANVPLFAGFMYSAVGSFLARGLRVFAVQFEGLPDLRALGLLALACYGNFFSHHFIWDLRWLLGGCSVGLFWSTRITLSGTGWTRTGPFLPLLLGLAGLVWVAENIATYSHIWLYPSQQGGWHPVGLGKVSSWYLLLLLSLVLVLAVVGQRDRTGHWRVQGA